MDDFYAARSRTIPPLPWTNFAPPLSQLFGWRSKAIKRGEAERPEYTAVPVSPRMVTGNATVEIVINGTTIRAGADVGEEHLERVIRAVRSA